MPDSISGGADMYRQRDATAESQHAHSMTHSNSMIGSRTTVTATVEGRAVSMGTFAGSLLGAILPALGLC